MDLPFLVRHHQCPFFLFLTNVGLVVCRVVVAYCQETKHAQKLSQEAETTRVTKATKEPEKPQKSQKSSHKSHYIGICRICLYTVPKPSHINPATSHSGNNFEKSPCHHLIHLVLVKSIQTSFLLFWLVPSATHQSDTSSLEDSASSKRADAAWSRINR